LREYAYELVMVVNPEVPQENLATVVDKVQQYITGKGGSVGDVAQWGKRRLAYRIKHFKEGHYVLANFKLQPAHLKELEDSLRISEEVIRHLVVRKDE